MDGYEMTYIASRTMEGVPDSFSRSSVKFQGHMSRKIDALDPICCPEWKGVVYR